MSFFLSVRCFDAHSHLDKLESSRRSDSRGVLSVSSSEPLMAQSQMPWEPAPCRTDGHLARAWQHGLLGSMPADFVPVKKPHGRSNSSHSSLSQRGSEHSSSHVPTSPPHPHPRAPYCFQQTPVLVKSSQLDADPHPQADSEVHTVSSGAGHLSLASSKAQVHGISLVQSICKPEPAPNCREHPLSMIYRVAILAPLFSFPAALYALCALLLVALVSPVRLFSLVSSRIRDTSFKAQLCTLLAPVLHTHERIVRVRDLTQGTYDEAQGNTHESEDPSPAEPNAQFSVGRLVLVLVLSPFLSIGLFLATWIAALFWIFALVLGNPGGTARKDDDGRAAVLAVCIWWRKWLDRARRV